MVRKMLSVSAMISLVKSQQRELEREESEGKEDSLWKNSTRSWEEGSIVRMLRDNCYKHGKPYQLVGNDYACELNCQMCVDCLRGIDSNHRRGGVSNHETISIEQLALHFDKLEKYSHEAVMDCYHAVDEYFRQFEALLRDDINRQKEQLAALIRKILLTSITKDERKLEVMMALYDGDYASLRCREVSEVSELLFRFVPKHSNAGFQKLIDHLALKQNDLYNDFRDLAHTPLWQKLFLHQLPQDIAFPDFHQPLKASRVRTEEDSPKKTLRRSIRREQKRLELKDLTVQLRKPLEVGSRLVEGKEEAQFLSKLFDHKNVEQAQLLYRASEHNFSVKDFHRLCDGESNTLVLLKTEFNKVIGGFTPVPWKSTANTLHSDLRCDSFLFSLSLKQKMSLIDQKSAIFNSVNFGPTFGAGADLAICHNAHVEKTSYSEFPYSYANTRYKENSQHSTTLFTGQKNGNHFLIKEWEVWKLTLTD